MIQKEAQERARQQALDSAHQRTPVLGSSQRPNPYATPRSSGSSGSGSGSGGIRNLNQTGGYAFSGGSNDFNRRSSSGLSPTQAFAMQPPGSYSINRGPSNYFQNQRGNGGGGRR